MQSSRPRRIRNGVVARSWPIQTGIGLNCLKRIVSKALMKISRAGVIYSALPHLILLVLFYSLAIHMWQALGGWPRSIGEGGFPNLLVSHAHITQNFFGVLL